MQTLRLVRSPFALLGAWWDRRCVAARIRWAQNDLDHLQRQREKDLAQIEFLRGHLEELRVREALIKP